MKGMIPDGTGLGGFIEQIRSTRDNDRAEYYLPVHQLSDNYMYNEGIVLCADICNTSDTFSIKKESRIRYLNLLEVFGIDPGKAEKRMNETMSRFRNCQEHEPSVFTGPAFGIFNVADSLRLLKNESRIIK